MACLNAVKRKNKHNSSPMKAPFKVGHDEQDKVCDSVFSFDGFPSPKAKCRITDSFFAHESPETLRPLIEKVRHLNNTGVGLYDSGRHQAASAFFADAECLLQQSPLCQEQEMYAEDILSAEIQLKDNQLHSLKCFIKDIARCKERSSAIPAVDTSVSQRMEFDEGLSVYTNCELIKAHDHPTAVEATIYFNLAKSQHTMKNYNQAFDFYRRALDTLVPSANIGNNQETIKACTLHCIVIPILHNLGLLAYRNGQLSDTLSYFQWALVHIAAIGGGGHTMRAGLELNCLGVVHYHLSTHSENEDIRNAAMYDSHMEFSLLYLKNATTILTETLGPDTTAVATCLNNLGRIMVKRDDFASALVYYRQALKVRHKYLGSDNINYAVTAFNAGQSLQQIGDYDGAVALYYEFLRVASSNISDIHNRDVAMVLSDLAQIYKQRNQPVKALKFYKESLRVGRAALGSLHPELAMLLGRLGNFYFEQENFDKALEIYHEGLLVERAVLQVAHPNEIITCSNIGEIYRQKGNYKKAIEMYSEAMELQKIRYGSLSAEVASALNVIGLMHNQYGEFDLALNKLQDALVMRRTVLGDDHLDVAATLTYLGTIFYRRKMVSTSLQLFTESWRIRQSKLGNDHRDVSFILYNIGLCHQLQGDFKQSIVCFTETLRVERDFLGEHHRDVALTLYKLGEAYTEDGQLDIALKCFYRVLETERSLIDANRNLATTAETLNAIGNLYLIKGDVAKMMAAFVESARTFHTAGQSITAVTVSGGLKIYAAVFDSAAPVA